MRRLTIGLCLLGTIIALVYSYNLSLSGDGKESPTGGDASAPVAEDK